MICKAKGLPIQKPGTVRNQVPTQSGWGAISYFLRLVFVGDYAAQGTNQGYSFLGSYLGGMVESKLMTEEEAIEIIRRANIATDARAQLAKIQEAIQHLENEIPKNRRPHQGRIQVQRNTPLIDQSEPWSQLFPFRKKQGQLLLNVLWNKLPKNESSEFGGTFDAARKWIKDNPGVFVGPGNPTVGMNFYSRFHSYHPNSVKHNSSRVDIEVFIGIAFKE